MGASTASTGSKEGELCCRCLDTGPMSAHMGIQQLCSIATLVPGAICAAGLTRRQRKLIESEVTFLAREEC